jgi:RNA methyltransferase, TrmH family
MFSKSTAKYIQSLQHKKFRDELNAFVVEGPKVVTELLNESNISCTGIYIEEDRVSDMPASVQKFSDIITPVKSFELEKLSALHTPNQVVAVFKKKDDQPVTNVRGNVTLLLDGIQDPGNFGTIIRLADWFGIKNIVCSHDTVDQYNPKVVQSTMASLARVNIFYDDPLEWLTGKDVGIYVAALDGKSVKEMKPITEGIIVIGNESKGVQPALMDIATERITIPRLGKAESLNAAIATGIILYALTR